MTTRKNSGLWRDLLEERFTKEEIAAIKSDALLDVEKQRTLKELRQLMRVTQVELAQVIELSQSRLSALENNHDHLLSTIRKYIEGLGGHLELTAVFESEDGEEMRIPLEEVVGDVGAHS